jgi:hypothetical protein
MRTGDRTSDITVHSFVIRRCHENVCKSLRIYPSVFVAAEKCFQLAVVTETWCLLNRFL